MLHDPNVRFAGYRRPHPLFDLVEFKVQTNNEQYQPHRLVDNACNKLVQHIESIESSFERALQEYDNNAGAMQYDKMTMG